MYSLLLIYFACALTCGLLSCLVLTNYVPKFQMSSGPCGPILLFFTFNHCDMIYSQDQIEKCQSHIEKSHICQLAYNWMVQSDISNIDLKFDQDSLFTQIWMSKIHTYLDRQRVSSNKMLNVICRLHSIDSFTKMSCLSKENN